jgi:hypothetical protein
MKCQLAQDNNPTHQTAIDTATTCILEYQATYPTLVARQQTNLGLWTCISLPWEHDHKQEV